MKKWRRKSLIVGVVILTGVLMIGLLVTGIVQWKKHRNREEAMKIEAYHNELFGENVYIFSPEDDPAKVNEILADIYAKQETNQFGNARYAVYFMPGTYDESIGVDVGFYTQVAGLGVLPTDTRIQTLNCTARWLSEDDSNHNACCNFWRGVENLTIGSNTMWAVSQATFMRRMQIDGALFLHDEYGWCSGGFLADSNTEWMTDSGSQQQWLSRNCNWRAWMGANWNMVFVGTEEDKAPEGAWPGVPYTKVEETECIQEKPFLIYDEKDGFQVYVPEVRENAVGTSWKNGSSGECIPMSEFYVAKAETDNAETMNKALAEGKHLLLTPGIYELENTIKVENPDTIVLGMGLATLKPVNGNECMQVADKAGIILAGILFDAGETETENLLVVGTDESLKAQEETSQKNTQTTVSQSEESSGRTFITLSDLFFRVGGTVTANPTKTKCCVTINSDHVIGDNFWVWRADHGDQVAWDKNTADTGLVVNGDDVTIYALMVEHFEKYQTIWNGNGGKVYMYQSEIPYDVPSQEVWMSHDGTMEGYASFYVDEVVESFEAWGLGVYLYNRDTAVTLNTAMEVPDKEGVKVHNICTVMLNGYPGMNHVINNCGDAVQHAVERQIICEYENGRKK